MKDLKRVQSDQKPQSRGSIDQFRKGRYPDL